MTARTKKEFSNGNEMNESKFDRSTVCRRSDENWIRFF